MANNNQNSYVDDNSEVIGEELENGGLSEANNVNDPMTWNGGAVSKAVNGFKQGFKDGLAGNPNNSMAKGVGAKPVNNTPSGGQKKPNDSEKKDNDLKQNGYNPATGLSKPNGNNNSGGENGGLGNIKKSNGNTNAKTGDTSPLSKIGNRLSNSGIANKARGALAKVGLGGNEGLSDKDEKEGKNSSESGNQDAGGSSLQGLSAPVIQIGKFKISIAVLSMVGVFVGILFAILLFVSLVSVFDDDSDDDLCAESSSSGTYTGSQDALEFMCKMKSPFGDNNNHIVTCKAGDNVYHTTHTHQGIDIGCSTGDPIYAVQDAVVVGSGYDGGRGYYVFLDHEDGFGTVYQHLSQASNVNVNQRVTKGQQIGTCGSTGQSSGPHLHFEITTNPSNPWNHYLTVQNDYFGPENSNIGPNIESFMKNCGSTGSDSSSTDSTEHSSADIKPYDEIKVLDIISKNVGESKNISPEKSGLVFQSFAYNNGSYYLQAIKAGDNGNGGIIYKYDSDLKLQDSSSGIQDVGHGNGLAYSTSDNKLYSVTKASVGNNRKAKVIDSGSLDVEDSKDLKNGTSSIAYDRKTNRFITSSGASNGSASSTGHLYVYDSNLSEKVGAKEIAKKRWSRPGDIAAYGGIIYVTIYGNTNYIDMYNEDTGDYLGSYEAPGSEIEGIDIDDKEEIVLLFHNTNMIQFTGIKAKVINGSASSNNGNQCCVETSGVSNGNYCPNGITVTGNDAGTYELDDYIEKVVTAENGGAHPEALKALAIAARTYAINRTNNCAESIPNSTAAQVMAHEASDKVKEALQSVKGSVLLYNGNYFSAEYSSFWGDCAGGQCTSTFIRIPSDVTRTYSIPSNYVTISKGHDRGLSQNGSNFMATEQGKTYDEILKFFYADGVEITGASSNSCSLGGNGTYKNGKIWDYNQFDYKDSYCGGTIADSGCGPTAMAMVVSTLLNEEHNPSELAKVTTETGYCSFDNPHARDYFVEAAKKYGLNIKQTEDDDEALTALNRGDSLVIVNVTNDTVDGKDNFWTSGGHYIVLGGHSGRDVWVQDPHKGSDGRTNSQGDGVYNFDKYIVPAAWWYSIISKN